MAYTPTQWETGDTITAEKLNKIESGIEGATNDGGVLLINVVHDEDTGITTLDKTWKEIHDAFIQGLSCITYLEDGGGTWYNSIINVVYDGSNYSVTEGVINLEYTTDNENGYPNSDSDDGGGK